MLMNLGNRGKVALVSAGAAALAVSFLVSGHFAAYRGGIDISDRLPVPAYFFTILVLAAAIGGLLAVLAFQRRKSNARLQKLNDRIEELTRFNNGLGRFREKTHDSPVLPDAATASHNTGESLPDAV